VDDPINGYLEELARHLQGRMPKLEVDQAVMEARSHLYDLVAEHGDVAQALRKFGPAKRLARRLLLSRETIRSQWIAGVWPLGIFLLYCLFQLLTPVDVLEKLTFSGQLSERWLWLPAAIWAVVLGVCAVRRRLPSEPLAWLVVGTYLFAVQTGQQSILWVIAVSSWLVVMRLFWAARQLLWKPFLAATSLFLVVAILTGPMFHFVVVADDGTYRVVNRSVAAETARGVESWLSEFTKLSATLKRGHGVFQGPQPASVPTELKVGGFYLTPRALMDRLPMLAAPAESEIPPPFFVTTWVWPDGRPLTWSEAVHAWRDIDPYLARIRAEKSHQQSILAAMPRDEHAGYWTTAARLAKPWAALTFRTVLILFEMNLITWLLWLASRRLVWPRRRFA
jgi:hypothetical protein